MKSKILIPTAIAAAAVCVVLIILALSNFGTKNILASENEQPEKLCCVDTKINHGIISDNSIYQLESKWKNQNNETIRLNSLIGKKEIIALVYTSCTYACPLILNDMKKIETHLRRNDVNYVLVSIDPKNDTPEALKNYANRNNLDLKKWHLLTGTEDGINELAAVLGFRYKKESDGSFSHSNIITVLNETGEIAYQHFGLNQDVNDVLNEIKKLRTNKMRTNEIHTENVIDLSNLKIKDVVAQNFHSAELFEKLGIDFCCKGNRPLKEALNEKKISETKFLEELNKVNQSISLDDQRYTEWDLNFLTQYIVNNHHTYVKNAIPEITAHLEKVNNAHGKKYPYIAEIQNTFSLTAEEMISHMQKEERILFPVIKYLTKSQKFKEKPKTGGFGTIKNPIRQMELEHVSAGGSMEKIRSITNDYTLPKDACTTIQVTYKELDEFEKDLHKHVHLENNILFPRAIELEARLVNGNYD
jgi:regulator of cell morphogenesis and NO signaling